MRFRLAPLLVVLVGTSCSEARSSTGTSGLWRVDPNPRFVIGGEMDSVDPLFRVTGAARLSDGVLVTNAGGHELRKYGSDGELVAVVGRDGAGPGEFRVPLLVARLPGDSVVVFDGGNNRVSLVCDGIAICDEWPVSTPGRVVGIHNERVYIEQIVPTLDLDVVSRDRAYYIATTRHGESVDTILELDGVARFAQRLSSGPVLSMPVPFSYGSAVVLAEAGLVASDGQRPVVRLFDHDGNLRRSLELPTEPTPITPAEFDDYVEQRVLAGSPGRQQAMRAFYREMPRPEHRSPVRTILLDRMGFVWAELNTDGEPEHQWIVTDLEGTVRAHVATPPSFEVLEVGEDYLLGVWRDAMDVEYVHMYGLSRD